MKIMYNRSMQSLVRLLLSNSVPAENNMNNTCDTLHFRPRILQSCVKSSTFHFFAAEKRMNNPYVNSVTDFEISNRQIGYI
jgi:hypothetical protein